MKRFFKFSVFVLLFILIVFTANRIIAPTRLFQNEDTNISDITSFEAISDGLPVFSSQDVPEDVYQRMLGKSIPIEYKSKVDLYSLAYLRLSYIGFDNETHIGEMIVNKKLSEDVISIFRELYIIRYPIEKMRLIDEYDANDEVSMTDNNTSCFCYRVISGSSTLSNHATGSAIDINPLYNPYVSRNTVLPVSSASYVDRSKNFDYKISKDDELYKIFISHGWSWGRRLEKSERFPTFWKKYLSLNQICKLLVFSGFSVLLRDIALNYWLTFTLLCLIFLLFSCYYDIDISGYAYWYVI